MKINRRNNVFIGITTLITVIIVLIIASFAALTFVSADNNYKMTQKNVSATEEYYKAESKAEEKLAEISELLKDRNYFSLLDEAGYKVENEDGNILISYTVKINENKELYCKVMAENFKIIKKESWKVMVTR